jgi:hypothetical protein
VLRDLVRVGWNRSSRWTGCVLLPHLERWPSRVSAYRIRRVIASQIALYQSVLLEHRR